MKRLFFTIEALCLGCLLLSAQPNTVFYNQGNVVSSGGGNAQTSLYIDGHMKVSTGAAGTSAIKVENSRIKITGNFYNDVTKGAAGGTSFVAPTAGNEGVIEFCGTSQQEITTSGTTTTTIPSKRVNFINFPKVDINNNEHVRIDPRLAIQTKDIELSEGWLIVDSKLAVQGVDGGVEVDADHESVLAHLLVDGTVNYNKGVWGSRTAGERGFIQVNFTIPNEGIQTAKSIVGFGIPFRKMHSDYFMFNTLIEPQPGFDRGEGFLAKSPIIDPKTEMTAGKGYVLGVDLRGNDPTEYGALAEYENDVDFSQRSTGNYHFNRHNFHGSSNQVFGSDITRAAYQDEVLNTEDVIVPMEKEYNYLSNPYTCPLNIDKLLGENEAYSTWGVVSGELSATNPEIRSQVWVLAPNSMAEPTAMGNKSKYTYNYQVAMRIGGTYIDHDNVPGVTAIAPLQMFVVRASKTNTPSTITIPKSERVMGTTRFLRNVPAENKRRDDFIIEFRNRSTKTTDRASIVLRSQDELNTNRSYSNVDRLESTSSEGNNGTRSAMAIDGDFAQSVASQIYTKNASGKPLTVQFLPIETTQRITLWHIPSSQAQALNILGLRLETKDKIRNMWLEDHKYNTEVEITPDMLYETWSEPTDSHERFTIRFSTESTSIDDLQENESLIYAYSEYGSINVKGFAQNAFDSLVELFDANGRKLAQKTVDSNEMILMDGCVPGVYIIKVSGNHNQNIKLIVK